MENIIPKTKRVQEDDILDFLNRMSQNEQNDYFFHLFTSTPTESNDPEFMRKYAIIAQTPLWKNWKKYKFDVENLSWRVPTPTPNDDKILFEMGSSSTSAKEKHKLPASSMARKNNINVNSDQSEIIENEYNTPRSSLFGSSSETTVPNEPSIKSLEEKECEFMNELLYYTPRSSPIVSPRKGEIVHEDETILKTQNSMLNELNTKTEALMSSPNKLTKKPFLNKFYPGGDGLHSVEQIPLAFQTPSQSFENLNLVGCGDGPAVLEGQKQLLIATATLAKSEPTHPPKFVDEENIQEISLCSENLDKESGPEKDSITIIKESHKFDYEDDEVYDLDSDSEYETENFPCNQLGDSELYDSETGSENENVNRAAIAEGGKCRCVICQIVNELDGIFPKDLF